MEFITRETRPLAEKKGIFLEYCNCGGFPDCICDRGRYPQVVLQDHLRKSEDIHIVIFPSEVKGTYNVQILAPDCMSPHYLAFYQEEVESYHKALELGLQQAMEMLPDKQEEDKVDQR